MKSSFALLLLLTNALSATACIRPDEKDEPERDEPSNGGSGGGVSATGGSAGMAGAPPMPGMMIADCTGTQSAVTTLVEADIKADVTWSGTVFVARPVSVASAAALTIAPGTNVVLGPDASVLVGDKIAGGALLAAGTAEAPIAFCGRERRKGFWGGVGFGRYTRSDSVLSHVSLSDGGAGDVTLLLDGSVQISDVTVRDSAHDGVWASIFGAGSQRLNVQNNGGVAAVALTSEALNTFPSGGMVSGNTENLVRVRVGTIDQETHFKNVGVPYLHETGMLVKAGAKLVFEAGVEVQFAGDTGLDVGAGNNPGELSVLGTVEAPVVLRGVTQTPGFWQGIAIGDRALTSTRLEHVRISDAGGKERVALWLDVAATLIDVALKNNALGMRIGAAGLNASSAQLSISGTQGAPLTVAPDALVTLPPQSTFSGNTQDQIVIEGGPFGKQGSVANFGVPYVVAASVSMGDGSALTIAPGTKFLMGPNTSWVVGDRAVSAKIVAKGSAEQPIEFTGQVPSAGSWGSIIMYTAVTSDSAFDHVKVSHGGGSNTKSGNLVLAKHFTVQNSEFSSSFGHGIVKWKDDPTDYLPTNTFTGNASAPVGAY